MTVQELIDELMKIEDKTKEVHREDYEGYAVCITKVTTDSDEYDNPIILLGN